MAAVEDAKPSMLVQRIIDQVRPLEALGAWYLLHACECPLALADDVVVTVEPGIDLTFCGDCGRPCDKSRLPDPMYAKGDQAVHNGELVVLLNKPDVTGAVFVAAAEGPEPRTRTVHVLQLNVED